MRRLDNREAKKAIIFVCVENAGRSQMAEAFFAKYAPEGYEALSAGTRPASQLDPVVVQAMTEIGIDISDQSPKLIDEGMISGALKAVNMGCIDRSACPALFIKNVIDWRIEDPRGMPIEKVRLIRDDIERRVKELVQNIRAGV